MIDRMPLSARREREREEGKVRNFEV